MSTTHDLISAIKAKDWHRANESFAQTMASKLADRLATERKTLGESVLCRTVKESLDRSLPLMSQASVQAVYDEFHDISETELLCGVRKLKVSAAGEIISYVLTTNESYTQGDSDGTEDEYDRQQSNAHRHEYEDDADKARCLTCGETYPCRGVLQGTHAFKSDKSK